MAGGWRVDRWRVDSISHPSPGLAAGVRAETHAGVRWRGRQSHRIVGGAEQLFVLALRSDLGLPSQPHEVQDEEQRRDKRHVVRASALAAAVDSVLAGWLGRLEEGSLVAW